MSTPHKVCSSCKLSKPLSDFWRDRSKKHGYCARCKTCKTAAFNVYRKKNGYDAKRYWKNPLAERERHLRAKYGVTLIDYNNMFNAQDEACAICRRRVDGALNIDHDHATGAVRGLLCSSCNRMLGYAGDDPQRLLAAVEYLKNPSCLQKTA